MLSAGTGEAVEGGSLFSLWSAVKSELNLENAEWLLDSPTIWRFCRDVKAFGCCRFFPSCENQGWSYSALGFAFLPFLSPVLLCRFPFLSHSTPFSAPPHPFLPTSLPLLWLKSKQISLIVNIKPNSFLTHSNVLGPCSMYYIFSDFKRTAVSLVNCVYLEIKINPK